jgi:signal transduction histidine kinase
MHMVEYAGTQIRATMDEARQTVWNLRAEERIANDMPAALRQMTARVSREHGVEVNLQLQGKPFEMTQLAIHELMMVAREAVFNAIMHGHPQTIQADLAYTFESLTMTIVDDGRGFDSPTSADSANHFGIQGMRERIRSFGGNFEIKSREDNRGTSIRVEVSRASVTR